ncbi:hypothetical protein [Dyadobacter psychrophilus]|uniref:Lipoprotein n=1 Tax=Dyadobacter psychrophilus TaxID=651661 RepID=A0A1T5CEP0_9BACT|nr:hypothetical protein [Dyadobacter psychrophilus]SKB57806.1 hypothetical protein SAMN05660293_01174 [Dyadobacter psychrophilus]
MKIILLFRFCALLVCTALIHGCNDKNNKTDEAALRGHYINQSFLDVVEDSIPGLINTYCYELDFVGDDSVKIFYGFEEAMLSYAKSGKKYAIKKALQDKDLLFSIDESKKLILEDSTWKQSNENSSFAKVASPSGAKWIFPTVLNEKMLAGSYEIFEKGKATGKKVSFSAEGKVTGIGDFESFELCFSGDCVGEVHPILNNLTLHSETANAVYAFQFNPAKKILSIYNIEAPIKDIKGERGIKDIAYELHY